MSWSNHGRVIWPVPGFCHDVGWSMAGHFWPYSDHCLVIVWSWPCHDLVMAVRWPGRGLVMVWAWPWCGRGLVIVWQQSCGHSLVSLATACAWPGHGLAMAWSAQVRPSHRFTLAPLSKRVDAKVATFEKGIRLGPLLGSREAARFPRLVWVRWGVMRPRRRLPWVVTAVRR